MRILLIAIVMTACTSVSTLPYSTRSGPAPENSHALALATLLTVHGEPVVNDPVSGVIATAWQSKGGYVYRIVVRTTGRYVVEVFCTTNVAPEYYSTKVERTKTDRVSCAEVPAPAAILANDIADALEEARAHAAP